MSDMVSLGGCCRDEICTRRSYGWTDNRSAGPVLRINPNEIHIDDPESFETLYIQSPGYGKFDHDPRVTDLGDCCERLREKKSFEEIYIRIE